jgi:hypothetical protein
LLYYKTPHLKIYKFLLPILAVFVLTSNLYSQRINVRSLIDAYGQNARIYFLSANRPSFGVSSYTTGRGNIELSTGVSVGQDFLEIPVEITYGISNKVDLFGGINAYTQSYDFDENKISGVGDASIGVRYKFHESDYFSHAVQTIIKIPTASKSNELGTGKIDFHFGLGHSYSANMWGYDASIELNLLRRRDFPGTGPDVPLILRNAIDSIKKTYNYAYEPEIGLSLSPAFYPASNIYIYSGIAFSRNTKLDYNSTSVYGGVGYSPGRIISLSLGTSYGLEDGGTWLVSFGLNISILRKIY